MSDATTRETIVTSDASGITVRLHVPDPLPSAQFETIEVHIAARVPATTLPLLAQRDRAAWRLRKTLYPFYFRECETDSRIRGKSAPDKDIAECRRFSTG